MNFFSLFKRKLIYNFKTKTLIDNDNLYDESLDYLFNYYGSDKADFFKFTNEKSHGFSKFYNKKLEKFKSKNLKILEIGSFSGASAAAFSKYFPNSHIFCFDINIANFNYQSEKIHVFGLDINNKKKVNKTIEKIFSNFKIKNFDLIIDDGSHNLSDILYSLKLFFKFLANDSYYVIEDFKYPNYYQYNRDIEDILVDKLIENLQAKKISNSLTFNQKEQLFLIENIKHIETFKGNLHDSDICFIKKK